MRKLRTKPSPLQHRVTMHNAAQGWTSRIDHYAKDILALDSITDETRATATRIEALAQQLRDQLRTRIDPL